MLDCQRGPGETPHLGVSDSVISMAVQCPALLGTRRAPVWEGDGICPLAVTEPTLCPSHKVCGSSVAAPREFATCRLFVAVSMRTSRLGRIEIILFCRVPAPHSGVSGEPKSRQVSAGTAPPPVYGLLRVKAAASYFRVRCDLRASPGSAPGKPG
jgi:hypothetical protein